MMSSPVLDGVNGGHKVDPAPDELASLMRDAKAALSQDGRERLDVEGEPILVVPDMAAPVRLPNLVPDGWPSLTTMIMKAVDNN